MRDHRAIRNYRKFGTLPGKGLSKSFSVKGKTFDALHDVNLSLRDKEFICLLGPSSCGKTTLLRTMAGLERSNSGEILLDGVPIDGPVPPEGNGISGGLLFPRMTVLDDVAFGLKLQEALRIVCDQRFE